MLKNITAACSSKFNRLMKVVFDTWGLFDCFKESRDTWNDPITLVDLFVMILRHQELLYKNPFVASIGHLHSNLHNLVSGGSWSSRLIPSDH